MNRPSYFPTPRSGVEDLLKRGDGVLQEAMSRNQVRFRKGHRLVSVGETQDRVYRLVTGIVARVRHLPDGRRQISCIFTPGDLVPARAIMVERVPDSIEVMSNATMHFLPCRSLINLAMRHPEVAFRLMWQISEDERRLRNNNVMLAKGTAKERIAMLIADILGRLALAYGDAAGPGRVVLLRQQDIADLVGLTVVHVNRTLRSLREEGAIELAVGAIRVRDPGAIFRYAAPMLDIDEVTAPEFGAPHKGSEPDGHPEQLAGETPAARSG